MIPRRACTSSLSFFTSQSILSLPSTCPRTRSIRLPLLRQTLQAPYPLRYTVQAPYRTYQHSSSHAPASRQRSNPSPASPSSDESSANAHNGIAYSRHELIASWHGFSRVVSPLDLNERRDSLDVNCQFEPLSSLKPEPADAYSDYS